MAYNRILHWYRGIMWHLAMMVNRKLAHEAYLRGCGDGYYQRCDEELEDAQRKSDPTPIDDEIPF